MVAMYGMEGFYLINRVTGATCGMDFGGTGYQKVWAAGVVWSPDGRYMAILTHTGGEDTMISFGDLVIVDTITGQSRSINFDRRFVYSLDWAPDSRVFLATVNADWNALSSFDSLYLVDAASGDSRPILPQHQFFAAGDLGALWSPDGKKIGVACSEEVVPGEIAEWRLCTVVVEVQ
jgi:dipeptidyl aminopeptidase/acylaminoacyl peptidase